MKSRYLTENEVEKLRVAMGRRQWLPLQVARETGLRIEDVLELRPEQIEGNELRYVAHKTGKAGTAKLSEATASALKRSARGGWCFPSPILPGQHLTRQAVWAGMKRAAKRCGVDLRGCSPHSLRKVYGVDVYTKQGLEAARQALQHERPDVTRLYTLSDWTTGENADRPLTRGDLPVLLAKIQDEISEMVKKSDK